LKENLLKDVKREEIKIKIIDGTKTKLIDAIDNSISNQFTE